MTPSLPVPNRSVPNRSVPNFSVRGRLGLAAITVARLVLGVGMIPYGVSKLFDAQFQLGATKYAQTLGEASGKILTWAFLGYSPVFQFLLGACETIPALLLLFAKTRRLGALLMFPVVLNVTLFNFFLDLWPATQIISATFLALNVFLLLYDYPLYLEFLRKLLIAPRPIENSRLRMAGKVAGFLVPAVVIALSMPDFYQQLSRFEGTVSDFTGRRQINRAGTWIVESLLVGGQPAVGGTGAFLYFDGNNKYLYVDGNEKRAGEFEANRAGRTFRIKTSPFSSVAGAIEGKYHVEGDRLYLDGTGATPVVALVLRQDRWGHMGK